METNVLTKDENIKIVPQRDRVNLYDYGYEIAGQSHGDPDLYRVYLAQIVNGDLVDEPFEGFTDEEKKERLKEIKALEKEQKLIEKENAKTEGEVKEKEKEIDKYRKDLLQIREGRAKNKNKIKAEAFSPAKFSLNFFILAMLSIYLFFFYVSAAYKALYVDFEGIAESLAQGIGTGSIMPGSFELAEALRFNYLLFVIPFVFYAFGWAFHIMLEMEHKLKYVFLGSLIAVTFTVDFLLAMIISSNTETAKALMGLDTLHWSQDPSFYIILFLGFLVYIIWSVLLDSLVREWDKREITSNLRKIIQHLQNDIKEMKTRLTDVAPIRLQIANYREDVNTVMYGNLKRYIDQFSSGWIAYLSPTSMREVKEKCLIAKSEFENEHEIKSGTVKVVSKRA